MRIGVFGIGHLGKIHLDCLKKTPFKVSGFYDPDDLEAEKVESTFGIKRYKNQEELIRISDAIDIVTPTVYHFDIASRAIKAGKHLFIEKPVTQNIDQAKILMEKVQGSGLTVQVGHVERYNPAFTVLEPGRFTPKFIEVHRLATFNPRGNDVSVIMDLMIHDLDLVLNLVGEDVVDIQANGINVIGNSPDICNARLTFEGGCVANLTASRISIRNMRKMRLFQENAYISIDFLEKESQIITLEDHHMKGALMPLETIRGKKFLVVSTPRVKKRNAIVEELKDFYNAIKTRTEPKVSIQDGYRALLLASRIEKVMEIPLT